ncbi:MAG TPA: hypothetical protein VLM40_11330, partial [Gemmata sp.]|nr:hypothetical protein [Gemmata sp.]
MIARLSVAAALFCAGILAPAASDQPAAKPKASVREVIYFGPVGPIRIRLRVSIDGKTADAAWEAAIEGLFAHRDRDGDGMLDASERALFGAPKRSPRDLPFDEVGIPNAQPLLLAFSQKDEKVSREAFAAAVRAAAKGALDLRVVPVGADSQKLSDALFQRLDRNKDGRLSVEELKDARDRLAVFDLDENEFVTTAELLDRAIGIGGTRLIQPLGTRQPDPTEEPSADFVFLPADAGQAVKQLIAARGSKRATSLKAAELGMNAKAFAALDQDGNGTLDTTELTAWLSQPPALDLAVSFDETRGRFAVVAPASHPVDPSGAVAISLPGAQFRFEPPVGAPMKEWQAAADALKAQFKSLAKEGVAVERKAVENQPANLAFFDLADRNADGKVDAAEIEAALKVTRPLAGCRVDVAFVDRGAGLFELLDGNRDGRLSPRELSEAPAVLKPFVRRDGTIGPNDLVRRFEVRVAIDPIPVGVLLAGSRPMPA